MHHLKINNFFVVDKFNHRQPLPRGGHFKDDSSESVNLKISSSQNLLEKVSNESYNPSFQPW